ncbi:MAG: hypothetical protein JWM74_5805 [Myxococcaceae bacterium]|jgi:hypothetical protein|nr:hypothetical protein [Myxococcaceae bacterium]
MRRPDDAVLDEAEIERLAREHDLAAGYREAARRALGFARRYREEEGVAGGTRERACIDQAQEWRRAVRDLHAGLPVPALPEGVRPGLARGRTGASEAPGSTGGRKTG